VSESRRQAKHTGGTRRPRAEPPPSSDPVRQAVREVWAAVRERDAYANLVLPTLLRERAITGRDAALATELTYGTCRAQGLIDAILAECVDRPLDEVDGVLLDIMRMGAYQLLRTRIPTHAAVSSAVDLARAEMGTARAGFVNAVLRRVSKQDEASWVDQLAPAAATDPVARLAFTHAHPRWIAQAFGDSLGADAGELAQALAADDARPQVHLVARPGGITADELAATSGGRLGRYSPYAVYLDGGDPAQLAAVREGRAGVQDEGSQLVARALTLAPVQGVDTGRWLDLCAGPGGKAALVGSVAGLDGAHVDAVEPTPHRAELVRKTCSGLPVQVHTVDGRAPGLPPGYDRVLVDAPCTGLGALRRRPEARWRREASDVPELVALQRQLLASALRLVRPGGVVVYATCSPHLSETTGVVADAVRRSGATQLDVRPLLPGVDRLGDGLHAQLWPHRHGTDAMFLAVLTR